MGDPRVFALDAFGNRVAYCLGSVKMYQAFEATIDPAGNVHLNEALPFAGPRRAVVVVFDDIAAPLPNETALLSEASLAVDWNRPEEDAAWAYLQSEKS